MPVVIWLSGFLLGFSLVELVTMAMIDNWQGPGIGSIFCGALWGVQAVIMYRNSHGS